MAQGREKEGVARVALGDDPSSDGTARSGMRSHQPPHIDAVWLYRAELQPSRVQSPGLFEAAQLRIPGPLEGGDCVPAPGNCAFSQANAWAFGRQLGACRSPPERNVSSAAYGFGE